MKMLSPEEKIKEIIKLNAKYSPGHLGSGHTVDDVITRTFQLLKGNNLENMNVVIHCIEKAFKETTVSDR